MDFLFSLMLFLHFVGLAVIIGTWVFTMKRPTVSGLFAAERVAAGRGPGASVPG